jgi:hypothetical protein
MFAPVDVALRLVIDQSPHQWPPQSEGFVNVVPGNRIQRNLDTLRESALLVAPA